MTPLPRSAFPSLKRSKDNILLLETEASEETSLMLSSVRAMLEQKWSTKLLRNYESGGDFSIVDRIFKDLEDIGVFQFVRDGPPGDVALLCELLGSKLLPGIVVSTLAAIRAAKSLDFEKTPRVSISLSDIVPEATECDYVIVNGSLYKKDQVSLTPLESLDPSLRFFKAVPKQNGESIEVSIPDLLLVVVGQVIGSGEECIRLTRDYAKVRTAFGKPIGSFQAVKHKLVDAAISVELCKSLYLGKAGDSALDTSVLKYASKKVSSAITDAIQIHGGIGFTSDVDLHLHLRRVITISKLFC